MCATPLLKYFYIFLVGMLSGEYRFELFSEQFKGIF